MDITIYDVSSGVINRIVSCPDNLINSQCLENESFILGAFNDENYYINQDNAIMKPIQDTTLSNTSVLANEIDAVVLQHLPIPCTVTVANIVYEVDDGTLEISFDTPGEYPVIVTAFPCLDKTFTVEAI